MSTKDLQEVYGMDFLYTKIQNIKHYAHRLMKYIEIRDKGTCCICNKKADVLVMHIRTMGDDIPDLTNSVLVCPSCNESSITNNHDTNIPVSDYLKMTEVQQFNDKYNDFIGDIK